MRLGLLVAFLAASPKSLANVANLQSRLLFRWHSAEVAVVHKLVEHIRCLAPLHAGQLVGAADVVIAENLPAGTEKYLLENY